MKLLPLLLVTTAISAAKPAIKGPEWFKKEQDTLQQDFTSWLSGDAPENIVRTFNKYGDKDALLAIAIKYGADGNLIERMLEARFNVNQPCWSGYTPLQWAILGGEFLLAQRLLLLGAKDNINHVNKHGGAALDCLLRLKDNSPLISVGRSDVISKLQDALIAADAKRANDLKK